MCTTDRTVYPGLPSRSAAHAVRARSITRFRLGAPPAANSRDRYSRVTGRAAATWRVWVGTSARRSTSSQAASCSRSVSRRSRGASARASRRATWAVRAAGRRRAGGRTERTWGCVGSARAAPERGPARPSRPVRPRPPVADTACARRPRNCDTAERFPPPPPPLSLSPGGSRASPHDVARRAGGIPLRRGSPRGCGRGNRRGGSESPDHRRGLLEDSAGVVVGDRATRGLRRVPRAVGDAFLRLGHAVALLRLEQEKVAELVDRLATESKVPVDYPDRP